VALGALAVFDSKVTSMGQNELPIVNHIHLHGQTTPSVHRYTARAEGSRRFQNRASLSPPCVMERTRH